MKRAHVASDPIDANLIQGLLEAHGIEAELRGEYLWTVHTEVGSDEARPSIWVADECLNEAIAIIRRHESTRSSAR